MSINSCCSNLSNCANIVKHLCRDYLRCSFLKRTYIKTKIPVCCTSSFSRSLISFSYLTIIVPMLVILVLLALEFKEFICKRVSSGLKNLCFRKTPPIFSEGLQLTEEGKRLLIKSLKKQYPVWKDILSNGDLCRKTGDIEWLSKNGVFRHRKIPGLIFRLPLRNGDISREIKKEVIKEMVGFANHCRQVCLDNNLNLLVVPNVASEDLGEIYGNDWHILVMEEVQAFESDFIPQNNLRRDLAEDPKTYSLLRDLEEQIVEFVFLTEYEDVKSNNILILNRQDNKPVKAVIFNFDQYEQNLKDALVGRGGRGEEYYEFGMSLLLMLETKEAFEKAYNQAIIELPNETNLFENILKVRKRLLSIRKKQKELHVKRGIKTGLEPVDFSGVTKEDFENCSDPILAFETGKEIIRKINQIIKSLRIYKSATRCGTCFVCGNILNALIVRDASMKKTNKRAIFDNSLLKEVCKVLVEKNIIADYKYLSDEIKFWF